MAAFAKSWRGEYLSYAKPSARIIEKSVRSRRIAEFKIAKNQARYDFALDINAFSLFWKRMQKQI